MAVDAARDDFTFPIQVPGVLALDGGHIHRSFESERAWLFAQERWLVGGITLVNLQDRLERLAKAIGGFLARVLLMRPRTVTAVKGAVSVENQGGKGEIEVKLEPGQVQGIGVDHTRAHELVQKR